VTGPVAKSFPLELAGWAKRSIFGSDPDAGWWAQLWPDTSSADEPQVWLGYAPAISGPAQLMHLIAVATGNTDADVDQAMLVGIYGP
jgi:hypothetical protein